MKNKKAATESKSKDFQLVTSQWRKRAAAEWTVGKLLTIILAVVLLALIIYGVTTGGLTPLKERLVGMWDNVLGMFGGGGGGDCYISDMVVYQDENGNDVMGKLTLCENECKVDLPEKLYVYPMLHPGSGSFSQDSQNNFKYYSERRKYLGNGKYEDVGYWLGVPDLSYIKRDFALAEKEREIYGALISIGSHGDLLTSAGSVSMFKGVWFRVDDFGADTIYVRSLGGWSSGTVGKISAKGSWNDEKALKEIYGNSKGWFYNHAVSWQFSNDAKSNPSILPGMSGNDGKIINDADFQMFRKFFYAKLAEVEEDKKKRQDEVLKNKIAGKKMTIQGKEYEVKIADHNQEKIFFVEGGFGKYGVVPSSKGNYFDLFLFSGNSWQIAATSRNFLEVRTDENVKNMIKIGSVYKFLWENCV